ncbi:MAG: ATP-dependent helicase, partial [Desulfobacterales bacterium]
LVKGQKEIPGLAADEARERLLAGYSHILVDEYQDIDEAQYELVSVIAGRTLAEEEGRLSLTAVGDDDQNIYTFRGANLRFIRKFQEEYRTQAVYLVENYRSTQHIIAAANALIGHNRERMKGDHPIRINRRRQSEPAGGRFTHRDPLCQGRVQVVTVRSPGHQAAFVKGEVDRLRDLDPKVRWKDFAVLARTKAPLAAVRGVLEAAGYPFKRTLERGLPLHRVREIRYTLNWLGEDQRRTCRASELQRDLDLLRGANRPTIWWRLMGDFFAAYQEESVDSLLPAGWARERLYEFVAEQRREKVVGEGIFLGTIHGAKGMEFPHVFILDGDWHRPQEQSRWEEDRRVMYVGMTRAEETLCLLKLPPRANPFLKEICGDCMVPLTVSPVAQHPIATEHTYSLLGLEEIYLDYGGCFVPNHPIHQHLARLAAGDRVCFRPRGTGIDVCDNQGSCIARLSEKGVRRWRANLERIVEVRVVALLRRTRDDCHEAYIHRIRTETWELPVLEVIHRPGAGVGEMI